MKKTIFWIILALVSGAILGRMTFNFYEKVDTRNVISYDNNVYLLKYGTYKSFEEMKESVLDIDRYIYIEENNKFKAYVAISKTSENIAKIKKIYTDKNIKLTTEKRKIDNEEFIQNLNEYEKLLSATEEESSLLIVEKQIISCYESLVTNGE